MDELEAIVALAQLGTSVIGSAELIPPWGLEVGPHAKTVIHLVQRGVCWLRVGNAGKSICLGPGDAVLVPRGTTHTVSDSVATPCEPYQQALARMKARLTNTRRASDADTTVLLCAEYLLDRAEPHPLLALLPEVVHIRADMLESDDSISSVSRLLAREANCCQVGAELLAPRLTDTLLVLMIRAWLCTQPLPSVGWSGALRDPHVGRALRLIHQDPAHRWTVAELAARAGQSRAVFARRFVALLGETPLAYVTRWRVNVAAQRLRMTSDAVEVIAAHVGYDSPTSFGKAFRKHLGQAPGQYRQRALKGAGQSLVQTNG